MATHAKDIVDSMKKRVVAIEKGVIAREQARGDTAMRIVPLDILFSDAFKSLKEISLWLCFNNDSISNVVHIWNLFIIDEQC